MISEIGSRKRESYIDSDRGLDSETEKERKSGREGERERQG